MLYWTKETLWRLWLSSFLVLVAWSSLAKITLRIDLSSRTHSETITYGFATSSFPNHSSGTCGVKSLFKKNHRHAFSILKELAVIKKMVKRSTKSFWLTYARLKMRTISKYFQPVRGMIKPSSNSLRMRWMLTCLWLANITKRKAQQCESKLMKSEIALHKRMTKKTELDCPISLYSKIWSLIRNYTRNKFTEMKFHDIVL